MNYSTEQSGGDNSMTKPFNIPKALIMEAYKRVKANSGSGGVDHQSLEDFAKDLKNNLYKLWNRLSSSYCIPAELLLDFSLTLTTLALNKCRSRWFEIYIRLPISKGLPSSLRQLCLTPNFLYSGFVPVVHITLSGP